MLYEIAFFIHIIGLIGWGGITTGAYYLLTLTRPKDLTFLSAYRKLVYLEIFSLISMTISGLYMWKVIGCPSWTYYAFFVSPILGAGEYIHWRLTYVEEIESFFSKMRYLSIFYTIIAFFLIYDMVFKPTI
ncbi:hypothetical protein CM19_12820 [Candidatus Acidianus copahuensis]|uniref:Copper resistance protein D domain-containing protein n=1 Tax=Candidatus Acidianus copahuensis TaxID=1160895 RepID=A0A031LL27_9CREN|nr:hypothetical protein [Candidatus Acidianus copahuensis]EZQ01608.1 hypothetical protein CM19_12820 [Candidatus Acidianus copahuensis]